MPVTVLLVDDEPLVRAGLRAVLDAQPDIEVVGEAADGAAVIPLVRSLRPDVVAMDVRMPLLDGIEATRAVLRSVDEPPKILVVHRFTPGGVTHADRIALDPNVQVVMDMDGFGPPWMKRDTFWRDIKKEPVEFVGWKQFTKLRNDNPPTPRGDLLRLWPVPLYIQIQ